MAYSSLGLGRMKADTEDVIYFTEPEAPHDDADMIEDIILHDEEEEHVNAYDLDWDKHGRPFRIHVKKRTSESYIYLFFMIKHVIKKQFENAVLVIIQIPIAYLSQYLQVDWILFNIFRMTELQFCLICMMIQAMVVEISLFLSRG